MILQIQRLLLKREDNKILKIKVAAMPPLGAASDEG